MISLHFALNINSCIAKLEAIHLFKSEFSTRDGVVRDESESLGLASVPIHNNCGTNYIAKWIKCRRKIGISKIIWKMVNEEIGTCRTFAGPDWDLWPI